MLRSMNDLEDYAIHATDGEIGRVKDFYFDDQTWMIRYVVVDTGSWLSSRKVLISPIVMGPPNRRERILPVSITQAKVQGSPEFDSAQPVLRRQEIQYLGYYGFPFYWGGFVTSPSILGLDIDNALVTEAAPVREEESHLHSCNTVAGYHIEAIDGDIGHVTDFLVDEETWAIRYLIVDTSNWWLGHQVLIAPEWIEEVRWADTTVAIKLTRQTVKDAPHYDPEVPLDSEHEVGIHDHYKRPGYWVGKEKPEEIVSSD